MENQGRLRIRKGDLLLILVILVLAVAALGWRLASRSDGSFVVVTVDGVEQGRYDRMDDRTVEITGVNGGTNTLVIEEGIASVTEADCPDKLCVHQAEIRYQGETIVCLPHKVVVSIEGGEDSSVDGVAH